MTENEPLSYWVTVARMGFENDFHRLFSTLDISRSELAERLGTSPEYVTKVLNGRAGNFTLVTMAKWARAIGAIVQIRLIKEAGEAVRVVDYETAAALDDLVRTEVNIEAAPVESVSAVVNMDDYRPTRQRRLVDDAYTGQRWAGNG